MPVDFAKVRLQLQNSAAGAPGVHYKGMADCIASTVRAEGASALFKGLGPALGRQMGYTGLSFLLYEPIRNGISPAGNHTVSGCCRVSTCLVSGFWTPLKPRLTTCVTAGCQTSYGKRLLAGGTAGGMGISVLNPMEVIKTQMQSCKTKTSVAEVFTRILRTDGVVGFWAGIHCILMYTPNLVCCHFLCSQLHSLFRGCNLSTPST